jgi:hypothetical protein
MTLKFVAGAPAAILGDFLVVADCHFGIEYALRKAGVNMPLLSKKYAASLNALFKENPAAKRLLVLGDFKHDVRGFEEREKKLLRAVIRDLSPACGQVVLVKGNHDGLVEDIIGQTGSVDFKVVPAEGAVLAISDEDEIDEKTGKAKIVTYGAFHGHAWPSRDVLGADVLLVGHHHPQVAFVDRVRHRHVERAWGVGNLKASKEHGTKATSRVVLFPAFNALSGGVALNSLKKAGDWLGPLGQNGLIDAKTLSAFSLDGVQYGKVSDLPAVAKSGRRAESHY